MDLDVQGTGERFYVTTFGLSNYTASENNNTHAPLPIPASIVRFGIKNTMNQWTFEQVIINTMDEPVFNLPGSTPINCYNDNDLSGLASAYPNILTFTDGSQGTEGYMRYTSGTGSWASPVLYKDSNGGKHLIVLNKSGCLMSVRISESLTVDWKIDLRNSERGFSNSYKFEFTNKIGYRLLVSGYKSII